MPQDTTDVNGRPLLARCRDWIDAHPRTGWYIAAMVTVNVLLNVLNLFH